LRSFEEAYAHGVPRLLLNRHLDRQQAGQHQHNGFIE